MTLCNEKESIPQVDVTIVSEYALHVKQLFKTVFKRQCLDFSTFHQLTDQLDKKKISKEARKLIDTVGKRI